MSWNPLNSLTGRLVLVAMAAVTLSHAATFFFYAHERGAALRQSAETAAIERVVDAVERVQTSPIDAPPLAAMRDPRARFSVDAAPLVEIGDPTGPGARIARTASEQLGGAEVRARARDAERVIRHRRHFEHMQRGPAGPPPPHPASELVRVTEVTLSARIDDIRWLNARLYLPTPRPLPLPALFGALLSVIAVGVGAGLVSRQIGRPLAELATAAQSLGAGETSASAPERGPDDVRRAARAFNAMAERLGRQIGRQRQMLWALSHDLRTPLTAIRLRAELVDDEAARQRLLASVSEMEQLTEQALSLARAGASDEPRREVDLAEIARTLVGEMRDLGMNIEVDASAPVLAPCRPSEIARAARNLAENAVKHAKGGVLRVYKNSAGEAVIDVIDDGPGVPESEIARLTQPFWRASESRSQSNGVGLGLAIAAAIADAQGGRIVLKNRENGGFSASIVLP